MKKLLFTLIGCMLVAACAPKGPAVNPDPNHTHADFAVWVKNRQIDFSDDRYMSDPVTDESADLSSWLIDQAHAHEGEEEEHEATGLNKYLHLHDGNGHVIHRHKPGLTIGDFFISIGFHMEEQCFVLDTGREICNTQTDTWQMFVNGEEMPMDPAYVFEDLDQILLTYDATPEEVTAQLEKLTDDACLYSKTCPDRGDPPTENCIADPEIPCVLPE